jgi:hypothetical protein
MMLIMVADESEIVEIFKIEVQKIDSLFAHFSVIWNNVVISQVSKKCTKS